MKRYFSVLTMICVFALAGIAGAVTQEANPATDFTYDINGDGEGVVIQKYKGKATAVVIPAVIEDFPVVEVDSVVFKKTNIVSIILPDSIRWIGDSCFEGCTSLQNVVLPKNLKALSRDLFYGCTALKTITLPNSIEKIYSGAFSSSGLESITIPDNVKQIGGRSNNRGAFGSCKNLRTVTIGNGTEAIGEDTFADCENLKTVNIGNGTEVIGRYAFSGCTNLTTISIGSGIRYIGSYAFQNCSSLTTVNIGVEKLEEGSYISVLEDGYEELYEAGYGESVFSGCSALSLKEKQKIRKTGYDGGL